MDHPDRSPSPRLTSLIAVAAMLTAGLLELAQSGRQGRPVLDLLVLSAERLLTFALAAVPAAAVVLACAGLGLFLLPRRMWRRLLPLETALFALGGGAGLLSVAALGLGLAGLTAPGILKGLVALAIAAGGFRFLAVRPLHRHGLHGLHSPDAAGLLNTPAPAPVPEDFLSTPRHSPLAPPSGLLRFLITALLAAALVLLVAGSFTPPLVYDVTEYHLGAYMDYLAAQPPGRIVPQPHNFYARFPFPVEALYHLGLGIEQGRDFSPKLLNAAFVAAGAALVWAMLRRAGAAPSWRLLGALLLLAHPVMLEVSLDAYIDAAVAFLTASAVYALLLARRHARLLPAAGAILGTALVSKYTVDQIYLVPLAILFLAPAVGRSWRAGRPARPLLAVAALLAALPLAAWLGKNVLFYGNPLEPFFVRWFRPNDTIDILRERFYVESHYPQPFWTSGYWRSLPARLGAFWWPLLAPLAALPFVGRSRVLPAARLALLVLGAYALWNLIRESQARFLLPCAVLLAALAGLCVDRLPVRWARGAVASLLLLFAATNLGLQALKLGHGGVFTYLSDVSLTPREPAPEESRNAEAASPAQDEDPRLRFYRTNLGLLGDLLADAHRLLPANARVLMVYEARPYLLRGFRTVYNTVWDESPLVEAARGADSGAEIARRLRARGITHVLVNEEELRRLIEQYIRPSRLRGLGLEEKDRPVAYFATATPEDLYPPFERSPDWPRVRAAVLEFLRESREKATATHEVRRPGLPPVKLYLAPLP